MTVVYMEKILMISVYCCKLIYNFGRRLLIITKRFVVNLWVLSITYVMPCWSKRGKSEPKTKAVCGSCEKYKSKIEQLSKEIDTLREDKRKLQKQNADLKQRSDELTSSMAKALEYNGALENVNDEYSNTKLSKQFENLYNNKWIYLSEWFDDKHPSLSELDRIKALSAIMKDAYKECLDLADSQIRSFLFLECDEEIPSSKKESDLLNDRRVNGRMETTRNTIKKKIISRVLNEEDTHVLMPEEIGKEAKIKLDEFFSEYIDMCWLMTISHPRLLLVFDIVGKPYTGDIKDRFKQYSAQETVESTDIMKGSVYEVVWPCVALEDGSGVYSKGDVVTVDVYKQSL